MFCQVSDSAPHLDVMLLKQQDLSAPGLPAIEYVYRQMHPLLQFLPQKLAEWIDKNVGDKLNLPARAGSDADWSIRKVKRYFTAMPCV